MQFKVRPPRSPVRPASRCRILLVSLLKVSTPLSLVGLLAYFPLCKAYRALFVSKLALIVRYLMGSAAHLAWSQPFVGTQSAQVGHPGVESMSRAVYISSPSKPVFSSSGIVVTREHAGISGFSAESSVPVQGTSCVDRAVSHGFDGTVSGGSCGKDTSPAYLARSQPGVSTQCAHVGYPGVELVSRATYISRKKRNLETVQRQSKALKKKLNGMRNANSLHNRRSDMKPLSLF